MATLVELQSKIHDLKSAYIADLHEKIYKEETKIEGFKDKIRIYRYKLTKYPQFTELVPFINENEIRIEDSLKTINNYLTHIDQAKKML